MATSLSYECDKLAELSRQHQHVSKQLCPQLYQQRGKACAGCNQLNRCHQERSKDSRWIGYE